jgi:predicted alpha/beta superfamily hydrolase
MMLETDGWSDVRLPGARCFEMASEATGETYRVLVRIPDEPPPPGGYPALWMLDGDASFHLSLPRAIHPPSGREDPGVIVAVGFPGGASFDVDARARNYTPEPDGDTGDLHSPAFGGAAGFLSFLADELRPAIAARLPLDETRQTLFGFSYGGLFTVFAALEGYGRFQRYWAASPSLWFSDGLLLRRMRAAAPVVAGERLVLTVGRDEQYPARDPGEERRRHIARRAMVDGVTEAAVLIAAANPDLRAELIVAADHDHFDMLMHGARRARRLAFGGS